MKKIQVQTPDGVREYAAFDTYAEVEAALKAGEIAIDDAVVYRGLIVRILDEGQMLLVDILRMDPMINFTVG